jgi:hypothetical protein
MDWQTLLSPWNIGSSVFGLLLSIAALVALVIHRRQIGIAIAQGAQRLFSPIGFFGLVIVVFMIISVLESGEFFNTDITHGAIFGLLGYALALGFDLVSVVCMQARLNATRMRDERGARLNLMGVSVCAAVSAFANAAGSLQGYNPVDLNRTPPWMQMSAPWLGMVFPALIVILSMTTDHILDHTPTRGIDVAAFRARERKRVDVLQVRLDTERELLTLESELSTLRRNREQASGNVRREWIFWRWLRPVAPDPSSIASNELKTAINQEMQAARAALDADFAEVYTSMHALRTWSAEVDTHLRTLHTQISALQEHGCMLNAEQPKVSRAGMRVGRVRSPVRETQSAHAHNHEPVPDVENRVRVGERILATFQQLGTGATDTAVAHASGYSRTTVARWRKRLMAQGQLPGANERAHAPMTSENETVEEPEQQSQIEPPLIL